MLLRLIKHRETFCYQQETDMKSLNLEQNSKPCDCLVQKSITWSWSCTGDKIVTLMCWSANLQAELGLLLLLL